MDTGLEKVVAAETVLSDVDGEGGRLVIRGVPVEELAQSARFCDAAQLLWAGFFAGVPDAGALHAALGQARRAAFARLCAPPPGLNAMESLHFGLSAIPDGDDLHTALLVTSSICVFTAAQARIKQGLAPIEPDEDLS
jgi:citrate synthase